MSLDDVPNSVHNMIDQPYSDPSAVQNTCSECILSPQPYMDCTYSKHFKYIQSAHHWDHKFHSRLHENPHFTPEVVISKTNEPMSRFEQEKARNREYRRKQKQRETSEEADRRRAVNTASKRRQMAAESEEQSVQRRKYNAAFRQVTRSLETKEERFKRQDADARSHKKAYAARKEDLSSQNNTKANEQEEARRLKRNEQQRKRRAKMSENKKEDYREKNAAANRKARAAETSEEKEARQKADAIAHQKARSLETDEARKERLAKVGEFKFFYEGRPHKQATIEKYKEPKYYEWVGPGLFAPKPKPKNPQVSLESESTNTATFA